MKNKFRIISVITAVAAGLAVFLHWQNTGLVVSRYNITSEKISQEYNGIKIVHISDLQDAEFGKNNIKLVEKIRKQTPDIIVITGDIIDSHRTDFNKAAEFAGEAVKIAPVYYVSGNHEGVTGRYDKLKEMLVSEGVNVLDNESVYLDEKHLIRITGAMDPYFSDKQYTADFIKSTMAENTDCFNIVLCHRPEMFETYIEAGADLTFCGHAHGGQIRLPFIGGVLAPHQGLFPEYTEGVHTKGGKSMVISRGLGNSVFPFRLFNRPEIVTVELNSK